MKSGEHVAPGLDPAGMGESISSAGGVPNERGLPKAWAMGKIDVCKEWEPTFLLRYFTG